MPIQCKPFIIAALCNPIALDIIEAIVEGRQPPELTADKLVRRKNLPISWADQREYLGFPAT